MDQLENQLAALFVANDDFEELERTLNVFCPFEAVGMVRQEIRHGHFLRYVFDPQRPHGFGGGCIKALMAAVANSQGSETTDLALLDIHLADFDNAIVPQSEWRNIDILIDVPDENLIVAIELKIDASEHSGQLGRYKKIVEAEWPQKRHMFLLLTKREDEPSEEDGAGWQSIPLDSLAKELRTVLSKHIGNDEARTMLGAYLAMLGRHHLNDERLETLAAKLWSKHREALEFLVDRRPNAIGDLFKRLVDGQTQLAEAITAQCGERVIIDHTRPAAIRFAVPAWDEISGFKSAEGFTLSNRLILIELVKSGPDYCRCYFQLGKGEKAMREKLFYCLRDAGADVGKKQQPTKEWNRLASLMIPLKDIEDNPDMDAINARVTTQVREFAAKHVPIYTKALMSLV